MAMSQNSQKRLVIYGILLAVVAAAAFAYYYYTQQAGVVSTQVATGSQAQEEKLEDIDSSVLDSKKFKELRPVVVPPDKATTTLPITELSDAELDALARKKNNPFIPSF